MNAAKQFDAVDDKILAGMASALWANAWADHVEETGCTSVSGCEITEIMPPIPSKVTDLAYKLACDVIAKCGVSSLSELYQRALDANEADNAEEGRDIYPSRPGRDSADSFGWYVAFEAMGAGISFADDNATEALPEYVYVDTCDLQYFAECECGCMTFDVHVRSSDEYSDDEGNTHSKWAPGRYNTVYLEVHTPDYRRAEAWANRHQTADGSYWETAPDLDGLVYNIVYDRPTLIAELEAEGYTLDLSEYSPDSDNE